MRSKNVKTFKSMLQGLTCERDKIGHLMRQARADLNHEATLAEVDVNAIVSFIVSKNADDRMAGIYLIDSICQNVGGKFVPLFEEHIFPIIETTYRYGTSQTRKNLCKILNIWKSRTIFPLEVLRRIYHSISSQPAAADGAAKPTAAPSFGHRPPQSFGHRPPPRHHHHFGGGPVAPPPHHGAFPPPSGAFPHHGPRYPPYPQYGGAPPLGMDPHRHPMHGQYPPPHGQYHHLHQRGGPPLNGRHPAPPPLGAHSVSAAEYESTVWRLLCDLKAFIHSPTTFGGGLFVETPALKKGGWRCSEWLAAEVAAAERAWAANHRGEGMSRKMYVLLQSLRAEGVNTSQWMQSLLRIAPFLSGPGGGGSAGGGSAVGICPFFNSPDGCRAGSGCKYRHQTDSENEVGLALSERVGGRYDLGDLKKDGPSHSDGVQATFYSFFGRDERGHDWRRKRARSISLLYSKKLRQCPNCPMRVGADGMARHLAFHFERRKRAFHGLGRAKDPNAGRRRKCWADRARWNRMADGDANTGDLGDAAANDGDDAGGDPFTAAANKGGGAGAGGGGADGMQVQSVGGGLNGLNLGGPMASAPSTVNVSTPSNPSAAAKASAVVISGSSQVVVCGICHEEFGRSNKEYSAQRDDWMLTNAVYADGTTTRSKHSEKAIVHRSCYDAEQRESEEAAKRLRSGHRLDAEHDDADPLRPKLHNPASTISKIEDRLNSNGSAPSSPSNTVRRRRNDRRRTLRHLFAPSDDEEDDAVDDGEGGALSDDDDPAAAASKDGILLNEDGGISKKRKLNGQCILDDLDDDDLRGVGIEEIEDIEGGDITLKVLSDPADEAVPEPVVRPPVATPVENADALQSAEMATKCAVSEQPAAKETEIGSKQSAGGGDIGSEPLSAGIEPDDDDDDDSELIESSDDEDDDDDAEIVLFDPNAIGEGFGYRPTAY